MPQGCGGDAVRSFDVDYELWRGHFFGVGVLVYADVWRHVQQLYKFMEIGIVVSRV